MLLLQACAPELCSFSDLGQPRVCGRQRWFVLGRPVRGSTRHADGWYRASCRTPSSQHTDNVWHYWADASAPYHVAVRADFPVAVEVRLDEGDRQILACARGAAPGRDVDLTVSLAGEYHYVIVVDGDAGARGTYWMTVWPEVNGAR
jgi:hypothetical protein